MSVAADGGRGFRRLYVAVIDPGREIRVYREASPQGHES